MIFLITTLLFAMGLPVHANPLFSPCVDELTNSPDERPRHGMESGRSVSLAPIDHTVQRISVVVPVYRELTNGNLRRLLANLAAQTVGRRQLTLVLVINNSPEVAKSRDSIFTENQETLRFLSRVRRHLPFDLRVVDHSTLGLERNMGRLRRIGIETALKTSVAPENHVLVLGDADTTFSAIHFERLIQHYERRGVDAVFSRFQFKIVDASDEISFLSAPINFYSFRRSMLRRARLYAARGAGTPQISVRADKYLEIGGMPDIDYSEDFAFARRLKELRTHFDPDLIVHTEDRARSDGFDAAYRWSFNQDYQWVVPLAVPRMSAMEILAPWKIRALVEKFDRRRVSPHELVLGLEKLLGQLTQGKITPLLEPSIIGEFHGGAEGSAVLGLFPECLMGHSSIPGEHCLQVMLNMASPSENDEITKRQFALRNQRLAESALRTGFLRSWLGRKPIDCAAKDQFIQIFCAPGSALKSLFTKLKNEYHGEDDAIAGFKEFFPEWLGTWDESPVRKQDDLMALAEEFTLRALNDPERYRGIYNFIGDYQR